MTERRDAIERLLELAGPRRAPVDDHYDRARELARTVWLDEVRRARRIRFARVTALSLAAAAVLVVSVVTWRPGTRPLRPMSSSRPTMARRSGSALPLTDRSGHADGAAARQRDRGPARCEQRDRIG